MADSIAIVASLEGQAWAKSPDGTLRALKVGDTVTVEEVVITATGARIELDFGDGKPVAIASGQEVLMGKDLWTDLAADQQDAAVDNASIQEALRVLNEGGDLTAELEETAAGLNGGGSSEGHNFVALTRVVENTDPNAFSFGAINSGAGATPNSVVSSNQINHAPEADAQSFIGDEDTIITGQVIATDVENDVLNYSLVGQPANGTITLDSATGNFVYTPNANYNGPDSFVVTVTDDHGNSTTTTISLTVNAVNDTPVSSDQNLTTPEDTPVSGQVVATDIEGDTLSYSISSSATNGTVTLNPTTGAFVYTPSADYNGSDSFIVTIADGNGGFTTSTITIGVTPVNDTPVSADQNLTTPEDTPVSGAVMASDVDGDTLSYAISSNATNGTVTLNSATGAFVYTPSANYNGSDVFVVTVSDSNGGTTTSTITIGVTPVNDAPVSADQNLTTPEDTPVSGAVVAGDVDGDTLSYAISSNATNGTVTLNPTTGAFVYIPSADYNGSDSFVVTINDGKGGTTTSTITIGVTPVNDAPVSSDQNLTTPEDTPVSGVIVASDVDGDTLNYSISSSATNGTVTLNPTTGAFVYTPSVNYNGSDSFIVTIADGNGGTTTSKINIGVTPVNDAPVSADQNLTTPEDTPVSGAVVAGDVDGDTLSYAISSNATNGTVTLNSATGAFVYTPSANYNGSDVFVVTVSDGNGGTTTSTITIGVTPVNDAPVSADQNLTTPEDTAISGQVVATDADGDALTYSISSNSSNGSVSLNSATGVFVYTPNTNYNGSDSFVVSVNDGKGGTTISTINIGVTPVNDAPVSSNQNLITDENIALNGAISATDPDGDTLSYSVSNAPVNGSLVLNPVTGSFVYTPNLGYSGGDSFVVTINDGHGGTTTSTVNIGIMAFAPANQAPIANNDSATTDEGTAVVVAVRGNDSDPDGDSLTVSAVTQGANGFVVIDAITGNPIYTPNAGFTGTDNFTYTINDGNGHTATANVRVEVNAIVVPVNQAPVAVADSISVLEGGTVTVLVGGADSVLANDTDAENDTLNAILVTGPSNGSLTLNSDGTFSYTHNGSETTTDSFTYRANDGTANSNVITVNIGITPVNDAPVAVADSIIVAEGGTVTALVGGAASVLTNDTDAEDDTLNAILVTGPSNGSLTLNSDGTFSYTHNGSETTTDSFTYKVNDGTVDGNTVTVNINVTPVNNAPVAVADSISVLEGGTVTVLVGGADSVLANDTDAENDTLNAILVTGPSNGSLTLNSDGTFSYTHNGSETTTDSFTYKVNDGTVDGNTVTVNINVTPVNNAPVAVADSISVLEGGTVTVLVGGADSVLANDTDAENDTLNAILVTGPSNGSLTLNSDGTFSYTHNGSETTTDSFTYRANDGTANSNVITVNIGITPVNGVPVSANQNLTTPEDTPVPGAVVASDVDGDTLSYAITSNATNGSVTLNPATGAFVYTPSANYNGNDSFTVTISDGNGGTATSTINIGVTPVNDAPVSADQNLTTPEDTPVSGVVVASDVDGDTLSYSITSNATNGTVTLNPVTGAFVYTPSANFNGSDSFVVTVNDSNGGTTASTINIGIAPVNDAPVSADQNLTTPEDTPVSGAVVANDVDGDTLSYAIISTATNGSVTLDSTTGAFVYTPSADFNGSDSFIVTINDGNGGTTTSTINIGVTPANDAPVSADQNLTAPEDTPVSGAVVASDVDGDTLSYAVSLNATNGSVTLNPVTGAFVYTPSTNYNGNDSFTVTISDGNGGTTTSTINIGIAPVNDAPVSADQNLTTPEDTPVSGVVVASDVDGDTLSYAIISTATNGSVTLDSITGAFVYTPSADFNGSDSFVVTINDSNGGTTTSTINIGVTPANDAPVSADQNLTTSEDTPVSGAVIANDVDGDTLSYAITSNATNGSVTLNPATGAFVYTPSTNYNGSDSFTVTISDGNGGTATSTINIGVTPVNDAPVSADQNLTTPEDTPVSGVVVASDVDGDTLSYAITSTATNGSVTLDSTTGAFVYTPSTNYKGSDSFVVTVADGNGGTTTSTINIGVTPVNHVPVATNDPVGAAYSVQLGDANTSDLWTSLDSKGLSVAVNGYNSNGTAATLYLNTIDGNTNTLGVNGSPRTVTTKVPDQIEYDQTTGKSESLEIALNGNVNQATFSISRLIPGENGGELGMWSAYYKGTLVAQSMFRLFGSSDAGAFAINTGGLVFDSVKFTALNTSNGTGDGGDYFLTGFSASGSDSLNTGYTLAEGSTVNIGSGSSLKLISNDTDSDGDTLVVTAINNVGITDGNSISLTYGSLIIHTDGSFSYSANKANSLSSGQVVTDSFTYTISDGHGGTSTATATMTIIGKDLTGTSGNDVLVGGDYSEQIVGGRGNDTMTGGAGADTFKWSLNEQGSKGSPAVDTITDFSTAQGDKLDLRDLLQNENSGNLTNYLHFSSDGTNTTVSVSSTGSFNVNDANYAAVTDQTIVLNNVNLTTIGTGTDTDIINQLKANGNLITD